jgi:signal transduction histidine kinase
MTSEDIRNNFLMILNHEILSPINIIKGFSQIISNNEDLTINNAKTYSKYIENAANDLHHKFSRMLEISLMNSNKYSIKSEYFCPNELFLQLHQIFSKQIKKKQKLFFEVNLNQQTIFFTDRQLTYNMLYNLIENSIKFTDEGFIKVSVSQSSDSKLINFNIVDSGRKFPISLQNYLTEPFTQNDMSLSRSQKGLGLGLFYVKCAIYFLGGKILLSKTNAGLNFNLTIPNL